MNNNTTRNFGPIETKIIARLSYEDITVITAKELDELFGLSPVDRAKIVFRLKRKNILAPIKRGVYVFSPLEAGSLGRGIDEFLIPPLYCPKNDYYIGYSTMFNYYGFSEQLFQTVYVLNTSFRREKSIGGVSFKFLKISEKRMYGLKTIQVKDQDVIISDKERTMIDLLYFSKSLGGIGPASSIFKQIIQEEKCDIKNVIGYACAFPNVTLRKRVGILLESVGVKELLLRPLERSVKDTAISSLAGSRRGTINKKWRVIINASSR